VDEEGSIIEVGANVQRVTSIATVWKASKKTVKETTKNTAEDTTKETAGNDIAQTSPEKSPNPSSTSHTFGPRVELLACQPGPTKYADLLDELKRNFPNRPHYPPSWTE
jgi:hypothetical protein